MGVIRWDPFRGLGTLQDRMNRLFDETGARWPVDPASMTAWNPAVDIYETSQAITVKAEVPGVDREDIELSLENNTLTLRGGREFDKEAGDEKYHRIERAYGTFSRSFSIPAVVDEAAITADYKDGVLTIVLPKTERAKPKRIVIGT